MFSACVVRTRFMPNNFNGIGLGVPAPSGVPGYAPEFSVVYPKYSPPKKVHWDGSTWAPITFLLVKQSSPTFGPTSEGYVLITCFPDFRLSIRSTDIRDQSLPKKSIWVCANSHVLSSIVGGPMLKTSPDFFSPNAATTWKCNCRIRPSLLWTTTTTTTALDLIPAG